MFVVVAQSLAVLTRYCVGVIELWIIHVIGETLVPDWASTAASDQQKQDLRAFAKMSDYLSVALPCLGTNAKGTDASCGAPSIELLRQRVIVRLLLQVPKSPLDVHKMVTELMRHNILTEDGTGNVRFPTGVCHTEGFFDAQYLPTVRLLCGLDDKNTILEWPIEASG